MNIRPIAILDPSAGISGDMLLGALLAAGAPSTWLDGLPGRLGLTGVQIRATRVMRCGVAAMKVDVVMADGSTEGPHDLSEADRAEAEGHHHHHEHHGPHHGHSHDHQDHQHGHASAEHAHTPHRHVGELIARIGRAALSDWVKERAVRAFRLLGEAEGAIHGVPAEQVALHEVGAMDALVDIVGAIEGFEQLGITRVHHRPVALGSGWIKAAHGTMSVPAPATMRLLAGIEIAPDGPVRGEATTPTGAVLLRVLSEGPVPDGWRPLRDGWGAGGRDPEDYPNALRLIVAEPASESSSLVMLSTDIDDLSPEYLEPLRTALFAAGALDVQMWSTVAKKGRIGFRIEALVVATDEARLCEAFFRHSTTAGVRRSTVTRRTLPRRELVVSDPGGDVRVKILETDDGVRAKPEYEDVVRASARSGRPAHEIAREVQARALTMLAGQSARPAGTQNQEQA